MVDTGDDTAREAPLTLTYTPTAADVRDGLKVQTRAAGRLVPGTARFNILLFGMLVGIVFLAGRLFGARFTALDLVLLVPVAVLVFGLVTWLQHRAHQRVAEAHGTLEMSFDDSGVTVVSATSRTENGWAAYGRYVETPKAFILLSPGRSAMIFTALPKRGLSDPADVDRLRALLDRHLRGGSERPATGDAG